MAPMPIGSGNELKSPFATVWPWVTVNPLRGSVLIFNGTPSGSASAAARSVLCCSARLRVSVLSRVI